MKGLILKGANNSFSVECEDGNIRACTIKGKILKDCEGYYNPIAAGDFVKIEPDVHSKNEGLILELEKRKNCFLRKNPKSDSPQLLASNIDLIICVSSAANPPFRPRFTDRILVQAGIQSIPVLIVINKCDLQIEADVVERINDWKRLGYEVLCVSAKTKENTDELIKKMSGLTSAVIGQSGVGKSSLLNSISPELNLKTSKVSDKYDRGTHTTTQGEFFKIKAKTLDGGVHMINIIDTPGVRNFFIWGIESEETALYFPEFEPLIGKCKFGLSCSHIKEPGCAVLEALKKGKIHKDRYASWKLMTCEE
ncbi:ribosome small subunit-dependent GTPase A [Treponema pedis]|uniref:ribosome small subunit-dependent GTPase A n=1 Tax=Treponema pedis TaxID=409322 RepID=UPI0004072713|nr:ribosome small subunit-dependent GTPase A [Treponema pedis]